MMADESPTLLERAHHAAQLSVTVHREAEASQRHSPTRAARQVVTDAFELRRQLAYLVQAVEGVRTAVRMAAIRADFAAHALALEVSCALLAGAGGAAQSPGMEADALLSVRNVAAHLRTLAGGERVNTSPIALGDRVSLPDWADGDVGTVTATGPHSDRRRVAVVLVDGMGKQSWPCDALELLDKGGA